MFFYNYQHFKMVVKPNLQCSNHVKTTVSKLICSEISNKSFLQKLDIKKSQFSVLICMVLLILFVEGYKAQLVLYIHFSLFYITSISKKRIIINGGPRRALDGLLPSGGASGYIFGILRVYFCVVYFWRGDDFCRQSRSLHLLWSDV